MRRQLKTNIQIRTTRGTYSMHTPSAMNFDFFTFEEKCSDSFHWRNGWVKADLSLFIALMRGEWYSVKLSSFMTKVCQFIVYFQSNLLLAANIKMENYFAFESTKLHHWQQEENSTYRDIFTTSQEPFGFGWLLKDLQKDWKKFEELIGSTWSLAQRPLNV